MRFFTARGLALAAAIPVLLVFSVVPGCANQGEGDRCGSPVLQPIADDNADCGDGLVCTPKSSLLVATTPRCCYPGGRVTDSRCLPAEVTPASGGASGGGAVGAAGATEQAAGAGG
jgi:hypothetical protein